MKGNGIMLKPTKPGGGGDDLKSKSKDKAGASSKSGDKKKS